MGEKVEEEKQKEEEEDLEEKEGRKKALPGDDDGGENDFITAHGLPVGSGAFPAVSEALPASNKTFTSELRANFANIFAACFPFLRSNFHLPTSSIHKQ